jgi:alkaline phosphatase D
MTYREYIPHYPLPAGDHSGAICQSFEVGRVKFILTDLRSERTPDRADDDARKTMLGAAQKAWFKHEVLAARERYPLVFWVSSVSWIGSPNAASDSWSGFATERRELANFFKKNRINNLVILAGDAHLTGADDGTHGDFAEGGGAPIRQLMSSPLDQVGGMADGPYSHGAYAPELGEGMYGLVMVEDHPDRIDVTFTGLNHRDEAKVTYRFSVPAR